MELSKKVELIVNEYFLQFIKKISNKYNIPEMELTNLWKEDDLGFSQNKCSHRYTKGSQVGQQCQSKVSGGAEMKCSRHRNQKTVVLKSSEERPVVDLVEKFASQNLNIVDSDDSE